MSTSQFNETRPIVQQVILDVDIAEGEESVLDWGSDNFRIDAMVATSTEPIDHVLTVILHSSLDTPLGSVNIPAGAGHGAVPAVDVLGGLPSILRNGWAMTPAESVHVALEVTCSTGLVAVTAIGGVV
jgi:hypothetical protein